MSGSECIDIDVVHADITTVPADLLVLKHADGFYGADRVVAEAVGFSGYVPEGGVHFCPGSGTAARSVLFIGVGPLHQFRYEKIQSFGVGAISACRAEGKDVRTVALTVHGPGYGLDPEESFLALIAGLVTEVRREVSLIRTIKIAEISAKRCEIMQAALAEHLADFGLDRTIFGGRVAVRPRPALERAGIDPKLASNVVEFGSRTEERPRLFVAMPFSEDFVDEFDIAFLEAAKSNGYICERLDVEAFTGDIVVEIKQRIIDSHGVIALLNNLNPNVFLEVGFAWAHNRPTILVARDDVKLPFDVSGHKCIRYRSIKILRDALSNEIASLKKRGILSRSA